MMKKKNKVGKCPHMSGASKLTHRELLNVVEHDKKIDLTKFELIFATATNSSSTKHANVKTSKGQQLNTSASPVYRNQQ